MVSMTGDSQPSSPHPDEIDLQYFDEPRDSSSQPVDAGAVDAFTAMALATLKGFNGGDLPVPPTGHAASPLQRNSRASYPLNGPPKPKRAVTTTKKAKAPRGRRPAAQTADRVSKPVTESDIVAAAAAALKAAEQRKAVFGRTNFRSQRPKPLRLLEGKRSRLPNVHKNTGTQNQKQRSPRRSSTEPTGRLPSIHRKPTKSSSPLRQNGVVAQRQALRRQRKKEQEAAERRKQLLIEKKLDDKRRQQFKLERAEERQAKYGMSMTNRGSPRRSPTKGPRRGRGKLNQKSPKLNKGKRLLKPGTFEEHVRRQRIQDVSYALTRHLCPCTGW